MSGVANDKSVPGDAASGQRRREHFIPIPRSELVNAFATELAGTTGVRQRVEHLCQVLGAVIHREFYQLGDALKQAYLPFDPDADTRGLATLPPSEELPKYESICQRVQELLERANFRRLSRSDIEAALAAINEWGVHLHIDFGKFERLEVFARGDIVQSRSRRRWKKLLRHQEFALPVFQRLAVVFRLHSEGTEESSPSAGPLFIKLFKDIPQSDIESLLPGSRIRMTWLDQSRILVPTLTGVAFTVFKLVQGAMALLFAGLYGLLAFLGLVGGTVGYGLRSFFGYLRTNDKYQLNLTRNLYYQNLDNNRGAILRILDEAEEQEFREVLLAYFLMWRDAPPEGWTSRQLDRAAEQWLAEQLGMPVDFEIPDALRKLERLRLATQVSDDLWRSVPLDEAYRRLTELWQAATRWPNPTAAIWAG